MKTRAWLAGLFLLAMGAAQLSGAAPVKPPAVKAGDEEPMGKVDGLEIARADGFLGLRLTAQNRFVLGFYDAKKKAVAPNVARATLRWSVHYQPQDERTVLNPAGDGLTLTSGKFVRPPHHFKLFISLYGESTDQALESYVVDFNG